MLSKSDFLLYLEAPMHLWASKNGRLEEIIPSDFERQLMEQGKVVEKLAISFLQEKFGGREDEFEFGSQRTFVEEEYKARVDAWVFDKRNKVFDIYEIKSSTSLKTKHKYELAFQKMVVGANVTLRNVFAVYINKDYVKSGEIDFAQYFVVYNAKEEIGELESEVEIERKKALDVIHSQGHEGITRCRKPKDCSCLSLCHPNLPHYSIYDLSGLRERAAEELRASGISAINDIPEDFHLNALQTIQVLAVKQNAPVIDIEAISVELQRLQYPIYFLDYEAYSSAIPRYDGQTPYEQVAFQYSLHISDAPGGELQHREYLMLEEGDAGKSVVDSMARDIGKEGSIIVWNKSYEATRNKEMAKNHPEYAEFLADLNSRMFDLMEIFSKGHYVHPDFHGSASIKKVLPVLVNDVQMKYEGMLVPDGTEAMQVWNRIVRGEMEEDDKQRYIDGLLAYCALDTMAMVKVWETVYSVSQSKK